MIYRSAGDVFGGNPSATVELATDDTFETQYNISIRHSDYAWDIKYGLFMLVEFIGCILSMIAVVSAA